MKKNIAMRLASGLMLSCLLSTCVISGTFAKYTTDATGSDTARVAKFGVGIEANGTTFAKAYENDIANDAGTEVKADEKVVAPGTKGDMVSMKLSGTPEVAVKVTYDAELILTGWVVDSADYCPIVFTVNGAEIKIDGSTITSVDALDAAVEKAIEDYSKTYNAGTNLSNVDSDSLKVSWAWAFEGDDAKDTALGDAAADGNAATISLTVKTTVTQID